MLRAAELRKLIGKPVAWDDVSERYCFVRIGTLEDVSGRNVLISGNWRWVPHLKNLREATEQDTENAR